MKYRLPDHPVAVRNKEGTAGSTVSVIPGSYLQVKFDAHPSLFLMVYSACENPECACTNVVVTFIEEGEDRKPGNLRLQFGAELDIDTWKLGELYGETPHSKPLIQEFIFGLDGDLKEDIRTRRRTFREAVTKAARFRVSAAAVRKGHMVCAEEVFGLSKEPAGCGLTLPLLAKHEGSLFRIYDFYCMNPSCKCREAHLTVVRADMRDGPRDAPEPLFTARLGFQGKVELSDCGTLPKQEGTKILSDWLRQYPVVLLEMEERYRRIKAIGKRLLQRRAR